MWGTWTATGGFTQTHQRGTTKDDENWCNKQMKQHCTGSPITPLTHVSTQQLCHTAPAPGSFGLEAGQGTRELWWLLWVPSLFTLGMTATLNSKKNQFQYLHSWEVFLLQFLNERTGLGGEGVIQLCLTEERRGPLQSSYRTDPNEEFQPN